MLTKILLLTIAAVLLIYDYYAIPMGQPTESAVLRDWLIEFKFFAVTLGILVGHWGFPTRERKPWMRGDLLVPGIVILAFLGLDLLKVWAYLPVWVSYPGIWIALGIPVGSLWWNQRVFRG